MGNEEEEELVAEVEAVEAVYGTDCTVLSSFPPHFHLFLKPRTADVSSQQVFPFSFSFIFLQFHYNQFSCYFTNPLKVNLARKIALKMQCYYIIQRFMPLKWN